MRPIASCASSTAETFFAASATEVSVALAKLHCDFAKVFLPDSCLSNDAQFRGAPQGGGADDCCQQMAAIVLSRQHSVHDAVAVDKKVRQCCHDVKPDQDQQRPLEFLVPMVDGAQRGWIFA